MNRQDLVERRRNAIRDLAELDRQLADGEIDAPTADDLRRRYEVEAALVQRRLDAALSDEPASETRSTARQIRIAFVVALGAVVVAAATVTTSTVARPEGGFVTGNEATAGRDLSEVTNEEMEAVVANNPDVVPMRLRLAHRYLDDGRPDKALDHYLEVLEREDSAEAAAHAGWIVFNDGRVDVARDLLDVALEQNPDDAEAIWFRANVALYGDSDAATTLELTEQLLERSDLEGQRDVVEELAEVARRLDEQR